ncbi:MAG: beta-lactamase family protein [Candidatus Latescibacteria bacterium]|nr:beta-lactamase family protein [Candidatus Latescibacterota bacterium]
MRHKQYSIILSLVMLLLAITGGSIVFCREEPSNAFEYLPCPDEWLDDANFFVGRGLIPGALIMVHTPEWGYRIGTVGRANLSVPDNIEPGMYFRVGGMTGLMLNTIILQLEHERKLILYDTIDKLLGERLVPNGDKITLSDCLKMRSGLFDFTESDIFKIKGAMADGEYLPEEILFRVRDSIVKNSVIPDDSFRQSETGYLLASMVVEKIENKPLGQVFDERIFKVLDMKNSFYAENPGIPEPKVHGYENMSGIPVDCTEYNPSTLGPALSVVSTPFDTFKFFRTLFEDRTFLTKRSYRMMAELGNAQRMEDSYGLGLLERVSGRGTWRGCETAIRGYSVMAGYYMLGNAYILIFVNTGENRFALEEIFRNMLRRISGCPCDMHPGNNTTVNAQNGSVQISFQSGFLYGDSYNIYIGNFRDDVRNATPDKLNGVSMIKLDGDTFHVDINSLKSDCKYYWRVEAVRNRPENELENARLWRDQLIEMNQQMPWIEVPETERISGPVYSFILR